jgi:hypothetical protein
MRPNLSLETISAALAVLGTGVIMAACGGDPKTPVNANEVNGATEKAADGASHCGAGKEHKAGEAACSAAAGGDAKPADTSAAGGATSTATPSTATPTTTPADAKAAAGTPAPASTTGKKPAAPATPPAKKGGSGSCGAGTCSAKK